MKRLDLPDWVNSVYDEMFSAVLRSYVRGDEELCDIITQAIMAWDNVASLVHERSNEEVVRVKEFPCWMKDTYNHLLPAMLKAYASGDDVLGDWISSCIRELSDIAQLLETKGED